MFSRVCLHSHTRTHYELARLLAQSYSKHQYIAVCLAHSCQPPYDFVNSFAQACADYEFLHNLCRIIRATIWGVVQFLAQSYPQLHKLHDYVHSRSWAIPNTTWMRMDCAIAQTTRFCCCWQRVIHNTIWIRIVVSTRIPQPSWIRNSVGTRVHIIMRFRHLLPQSYRILYAIVFAHSDQTSIIRMDCCPIVPHAMWFVTRCTFIGAKITWFIVVCCTLIRRTIWDLVFWGTAIPNTIWARLGLAQSHAQSYNFVMCCTRVRKLYDRVSCL